MNNQPAIIAFLVELTQRLFQKTPAFFKIIAWISAIVTIITGLPELLAFWDIALPEAWQAIANKTIAIAGAVGTFISLLTVKDANGISSPTNLPLTAKKDK